MSLLGRANRRHFVRHPLQLLLAILGVALGVAMVVSIDLAAKSTHRAFALSMEALTGRYTHHLTSGAPEGLPETLFTRLRVEGGLRESAPAVEGFVSLNNQTLRLIGFDVFSERNLRSRFVNADELIYREALASYYKMATVPPWSLICLTVCHAELDETKAARATLARLKASYPQFPGITLDGILEEEDLYEHPSTFDRYRSILRRIDKME
jgi:hypothetical protein